MEAIVHIFGIMAAFVMTTLVGYVFWYMARGHSLKKRRNHAGQQAQAGQENRTGAGKDRSAAEKINDVMGYDFIPMRTIKRDGEPETVREYAGRREPAVTLNAAPDRERKARSWEKSRNSEFEDVTGRLGISSSTGEEAGVPEPAVKSYGEDDYWPEFTEDELDAWDRQMMKWAEEDGAFTAEDEEEEDTVRTDDPYEDFSDIWYDSLEKRDRAQEEIRKKSQSIRRIEEDADNREDAMTDEEIDDLIAE